MDAIYGGTIATDGVIKMTIDSSKVAYAILPNGSVLTTVAGVIDSVYTGTPGYVTFYAPVFGSNVDLTASEILGKIIYNGVNAINLSGTPISKFTANKTAEIACFGCTVLNSLIAKKAILLDCTNCSLDAKSIGDILYAAYLDNRLEIAYIFTGGNNALQSDVNAYLLANYGVTYATVYALLVTTNGGTITIDTV